MKIHQPSWVAKACHKLRGKETMTIVVAKAGEISEVRTAKVDKKRSKSFKKLKSRIIDRTTEKLRSRR